MGRVIILEGPDGGGKTTLAKELEKNHGFVYRHMGVPEPGENVLLTYSTALWDALKWEGDVVFDRLALGESIYGPIMRRVDLLGDEGQIILQRIMHAGGVKQVLCMPPYSTCVRTWLDRKRANGEYVTDVSRFFEVYQGYSKIAAKPWCHRWITFWDYQCVPVELAADTLAANWTDTKQLPTDVIGDPGARFLFVGEIANQKYLDLPWVDLANSSHFLNLSLREAGYDESEMAFTNAKRLDGTVRNIEELSGRLPNLLQIVGLGSATSKLLGKRIPHKTVPHPAYWKRFHSRDGGSYIKMLRDIRVGAYGKHRLSSNVR